MNDPIDRRALGAIGLAGTAALLGASARLGEPLESDAALAEISEARRRFAEILLTHDHASLPAMFTADTIVLPAGSPLVRGRDAAVAFWTEATSDPGRRLRSEFDGVDSLFTGGLVIEVGRATVWLVGDGAETLADNGKYMMVWKREEGRWKRHRDIFNSDTRRT